jgi:predicted dehydrogenase
MLRIAIIGCGKIADQHAAAIGRVPGCQLVAACDREILMARQLAERFRKPGCFDDLGDMLRACRPDVVHITTPPQSHFAVGRQCLEAGCHVYLEKPFTVTADETEELIRMAESSDRRITAGHNLQFTLESLEMRRLVGNGFLGGKPVHLESHFSYDLGDASYVGPLLGNRNHWVRQLPGKLLHNILSHGIAKLAEFLGDDIIEIVARAHQSERLRELGGEEVLDELRVLIRDQSGTTAFFCFSTQLRPGMNQLRVCGPMNSLTVDSASGCVVRQQSRSYKSYLTYFLPPLVNASEHLGNARRNVADFLHRRLHQDYGMKELIERFYQCISVGAPLPIPYREIRLTAQLMDAVFAQIYPAGTGVAQAPPIARATQLASVGAATLETLPG